MITAFDDRAPSIHGGAMSINKEWHLRHKMPKNPTVEQRIEWHLAHARNCGCRKIEGKILDEMKKRRIAVPVYKDQKAAKD
jgi:hypothetical protein